MELLSRLVKLEQEAESFGFCWSNPKQILQQIQSEQLEILTHLQNPKHHRDELQEEIGDLLHVAFSLCVFLKFDPKQTLEKSLTKFEKRLHAVKKIAAASGVTSLKGYSFAELMQYWNKAKELVG